MLGRKVEMKIKQKFICVIAIILAISVSGLIAAKTLNTEKNDGLRNNYVPSTISPAAQQILTNIYEKKGYEWHSPLASNRYAWRKKYDDFELAKKESNAQAVLANQVTVTEMELGGVPVLDIRPKNWKNNHKILVYLHGGGYTVFSPRSTMVISAPISRSTGLRVISVDYTTAPFADWQQIQKQVISVIKVLLAKGYAMKDIAFYGDSAGGGLVINTVLNLRDKGMSMPAAVVLLSPWADLTNNGDTMHTLDNTDPTLKYDTMLKNSAQAYANGTNLTDPHVSPIYADFSKGFAPTMIIEGTKCIFLSSSVRLYQALDAAHQEVKLDMYEGMWHVFQVQSMQESEIAVNKAAIFIKKHLHLD